MSNTNEIKSTLDALQRRNSFLAEVRARNSSTSTAATIKAAREAREEALNESFYREES